MRLGWCSCESKTISFLNSKKPKPESFLYCLTATELQRSGERAKAGCNSEKENHILSKFSEPIILASASSCNCSACSSSNSTSPMSGLSLPSSAKHLSVMSTKVLQQSESIFDLRNGSTISSAYDFIE
ncbi:hypothetical protein Ahy_Scaffold8g108348 isoform C [Arachis hypogaea]|uniref:Uncharacterized protein n=1 Tax=Arachis hypogaea TaxID=3818 RepID=A0A444WNR3_ARAHY|nr:hypothetical protein Ahy_Scaffold8g108348 isoform C [Arachis hypogaea]